jgi:CxxC-x17-CxxC domain-containing protein
VAFLDRTLSCRDCGRQFVFSSGEQQFYQSRGLTNEPGRCPECRRARKASRGEGGGYAYSSGAEYGSSGGYAGGGGYGGGYERAERPRRQMFPAVCSACGKDTEVPFQPRGDKPVYCSDCFENVRGGRF